MGALEGWLGRAATIVGSTLTIGAVLLWLVWPRVKAGLRRELQEVTRENTATIRDQLASDQPDTVAGHAKRAAQAASELPGIRRTVDQLAVSINELTAWQVTTDRRLHQLEDTMTSLLVGQLRRLLSEDHPDRDPD